MTENGQVNGHAPGGPAAVSVHADGRLTRLSVHVRDETRLYAAAYPAEGRVVLDIGSELMPEASLFVPSVAVLARLIDVLNESYTRLSTVQRPAPTRYAASEPAGARPRRVRTGQRVA